QTLQGRQLSAVLSSDRMIRLIEDEAFRGSDAYTVSEMLTDVRSGIWSELSGSGAIGVYRRNLQRTYVSQLQSLMESTDASVDGSDIKALVRHELTTLKTQVDRAAGRTTDRATRVHLRDINHRIDNILTPG
ncbi:MAG: zinc-dependent metalloprotease, partial [Cyclonatronaceae bacterium]